MKKYAMLLFALLVLSGCTNPNAKEQKKLVCSSLGLMLNGSTCVEKPAIVPGQVYHIEEWHIVFYRTPPSGCVNCLGYTTNNHDIHIKLGYSSALTEYICKHEVCHNLAKDNAGVRKALQQSGKDEERFCMDYAYVLYSPMCKQVGEWV